MPSPTIGLVANIWNEIDALPGWYEHHLPFFDDIRVYHAGPHGKLSDDGTMEFLEKWDIPVAVGSINDGFGVARNAAAAFSPCDWVMVLDLDERFNYLSPTLNCLQKPSDEVAPPSNWEHMSELDRLGHDLKSVIVGEPYNQGEWLRSLIVADKWDVITLIRRHWHDFTWKRPTQNWTQIPDYQYRCFRNHCYMQFSPDTKMHEAMVAVERPLRAYSPNMTHGPFLDHYHLWFKKRAPAKRQYNIRVYDALAFGKEVPHA